MLRGRGFDPDTPTGRADLDEWFRIEVWSGFTLDDPGWVARLEATCATFRPAPSVVCLLAEEPAEDQDADDVVLEAVASLPKSERAAGQPGVTVEAIRAALKRSDKTIRRALKLEPPPMWRRCTTAA